ncbi:unnamed protein product [Phytophthora fragariaefolia]|uniref:Unnamed protein product n=1 Tax=Phytophthora fragariaefolia TaxID=1490495 RepID=A0A9W7D557_9STRA|nr:unnamed protein product [Phytophthora fragariaefolia]
MGSKRAPASLENARTAKRARIRGQDCAHLCKSLQLVLLPPEIVAIPCVVETINRLAMTPQEALIEAVKRKQLGELHSILRRFQCDTSNAFVCAAGTGDQAAMQLLRSGIEYRGELAALATAAAAAAKHGMLEVVTYLVSEFEKSFRKSVGGRNAYYRVDDATWVIVDEAAAEGFLNVVKFGIGHAIGSNYEASSPLQSDAIYCAAKNGHTAVVRFLLDQHAFHWELGAAINVAVKNNDRVIVNLLYEAYPLYSGGADFLVQMARDARTDTVKYLYANVNPSLEVIGEAFVNATSYCYTDAADFLFATGRVSKEAFDVAVLNAASSGRISVLKILSGKKRASPWVLVTAARAGQYPTVKTFLHFQRQSLNALVEAYNVTREPNVRVLLRGILESQYVSR